MVAGALGQSSEKAEVGRIAKPKAEGLRQELKMAGTNTGSSQSRPDLFITVLWSDIRDNTTDD